MALNNLFITSTIIIGIFNGVTTSLATQKPPPLVPFSHHLVSKLPEPPSTPPPDNKTTPGGGLNPLRMSCNSQDKKLRALIPEKNPVLTTSNHPTLLFYLPDNPSDVLEGEFWLNSRDEKQRIYRKTKFKLSQIPGIIRISFEEDIPLEKGKYYHWYLKIYCNDETKDQADLDVNGWLKRVQPTPERQDKIKSGSPDIWYDSLAKIATKLSNFPQDILLKENWRKLLKLIEAENLVNEPQADSVQLIEGNSAKSEL